MSNVLRRIVAAVVTIHGMIHLLGAVKGFGWAAVPELTEPISATVAAGWLLAAVLVVAAGIMIAVPVGGWWRLAPLAALGSQAVIITSWADAWAGTAANVLLAVAAGIGWAAHGPRSFEAEYARRSAAALAAPTDRPPVTAVIGEHDLGHLPDPLAGYLRRSGAVGQPRITGFRASIHGRIRGGPDQPWMSFTGEQTNAFGAHPYRFFHIVAVKSGIPVDVLHVFADGTATMRGRAVHLVPFLHGAGPDMDRGETVTVFNDLCILAPAALLDAPVAWQGLDDHHVRGTFELNGVTVSAVLTFNDDHDLVDFVSDDRLRASADGRTFTRQRWSTPVGSYRSFGARRVAARGEARWHAPHPEGEFAYLDFRLDRIAHITADEFGCASAPASPAGVPLARRS